MNSIDELLTPEVFKFAKTYVELQSICKSFITEEYSIDADFITIENSDLIYDIKDIKDNKYIIYCKIPDTYNQETIIAEFKIDNSIFLVDTLKAELLNFEEEEPDHFKVSLKQESDKYFNEC